MNQNSSSLRLVQLHHPQKGRRTARVAEPRLLLLSPGSEARASASSPSFSASPGSGPFSASVYGLAREAIERDISLRSLLQALPVEDEIDYDAVYSGRSEWTLLPPFDHPDDPARCMVAGTGLTHTTSAKNRDAMHKAEGAPDRKTEGASDRKTEGPSDRKREGGTAADAAPITDTLKMFRWGVEGGKPAPGTVGVPPEWFYKGDGGILRAQGAFIDSPAFAEDGGDEAEVVGCYLIAPDGSPRRVGFCAGNEFADHVHERKNYLYLAESKLRPCGLGPEILIGDLPRDLRGRVAVERAGRELWSSPLASGEDNMSHTLANLEHHHFKHAPHRRPLDAHLHFFGADAFSFGAGVRLQDGDVMVIAWEAFGRALRNPVRFARGPQPFIAVRPL